MLTPQSTSEDPEKPQNLNGLAPSSRLEATDKLWARLDAVLDSSNFTDKDRAQVIRARNISFAVHLGQPDRPDGQPYVNHPLEVALCVAERFKLVDPDVLVAALFHDAVEDQPKLLVEFLGGAPESAEGLQAQALDRLSKKFSPMVKQLVGLLTNPDFDELIVQARQKGVQTPDAELKNSLYKDHFFEILDKNEQAFLIKLADFSQNAMGLEKLEESAKKEKLLAKYRPVMFEVIKRLEDIRDESNLSCLKGEFLVEIKGVYNRVYSSRNTSE